NLTTSAEGAEKIVAATKLAAQSTGIKWLEKNYLLLRRGPCVIAAGLDESIEAPPRELSGRFVNLFDAQLSVQEKISIAPGTRWFLLDLDAERTGKIHLLASACKSLLEKQTQDEISFTIEGVGETPVIMLLESPKAPREVLLDGEKLTAFEYSAKDKLLWIHFKNESVPR